MERPLVSIITVGMNHVNYLKNLLKSLYVDNSTSIDFEFIYIDNCSTDGSVKFIQDNYPQVKLNVNINIKGFSENNNIGVRISKGKYIAIINPDVVILKKSIDNLFDFLNEHPNVGIVVPKLLNVDGTIQHSVRGFISPKTLFWRLFYKGREKSSNKILERYLQKDINTAIIQPVDWAFGAALFLSREFYNELNGFDEDYFLYMEDVDLCLRSWKKNKPVVYLPTSQMIHNHLKASSKLGKKTWIHYKSMSHFFRKHGFKIQSYKLSGMAVAFNTIRQPLLQPRHISIQTIGTLRNKPALAYVGPYSKVHTLEMVSPELVTTFQSPAQYLILKEMRNKIPVRPKIGFMGKADLLIEVPIVNFPSEPAQSQISRGKAS